MASIIFLTTPLQQIPVPPSPIPIPEISSSSKDVFRIDWLNFGDHIRRAQTDNQSGEMLFDVIICCREPGSPDWKHIHACKNVLLSGSIELRKEILARPDNRPIYIWQIPAKVMLQVLTFLHMGTLVAPIEEMERFMLAKHQLGVGGVYGNDYSYQLIKISNLRKVVQVVVSLHRPWIINEYLPGVPFDDMKENKNCAAECKTGHCIHKQRLGNPSIRINLKNCLKITRSPVVAGNEQELLAPQVSPSTEDQRGQVLASDHDYCGSTTVARTAESGHRCNFCGRRFVNDAALHQHQINIHFLRV